MEVRMGIGYLPLEIFDQILAYLYHEDIVALSATCTQIRELTVSLVYRTIRLEPQGSAPSLDTDRARHFYELFRDQPLLADYVRHVELPYIDPKAMDRYGDHPWNSCIYLLAQMRNLTEIRIDDCWLRIGSTMKGVGRRLESSLVPALQGGTLERLEVAGPHKEGLCASTFWSRRFHKFIGHCFSSRSLKSLTIPVPPGFKSTDIPRGACGLPALEELKLYWRGRTVWKSLKHMLSQASNLSRLAIITCQPDGDQHQYIHWDEVSVALDNVKNSLEQLIIRIDYGNSSTSEVGSFGCLSLHDFQKLEMLEIPGYVLHARDLDLGLDGEAERFRDIFPPHLQELTVRTSNHHIWWHSLLHGIDEDASESAIIQEITGVKNAAKRLRFVHEYDSLVSVTQKSWLANFEDSAHAPCCEAGVEFSLAIRRPAERSLRSSNGSALFEVPWDNLMVLTNFDPLWRGSYEPEDFWRLLPLVAEDDMFAWLFQG